MPSTTVPDVARVVPPARPIARRPRTPLPVAAAGLLAVVESLALLAVGLTGLDGIFGTALRPDGGLVALTLLLLAAWVVLCAGGGAGLVDGAGRLLLIAVSCGEIALLLVLTVAGVLGVGGVWLVVGGPLGGLPLPALTLLALAVPLTKLLLAGSVAATGWLAAGPRPRAARPALPRRHRVLRGVTVGVIGLALTTFCLVSSPAGPVADPATAAVDTAP
ncbi:hypothetical protein [Modestobacter lapidis]|nr:hypothetical protein [Modestobacter lapidis]